MRTSDEIKADIEKLKEELKEAKANEKKDSHFIQIDKMGWVMKLDKLPKDFDGYIYIISYKQKRTNKRPFRCYYHTTPFEIFRKRLQEGIVTDVKIEKKYITLQLYQQLNTKTFLTKEDAIKCVEDDVKSITTSEDYAKGMIREIMAGLQAATKRL